MAKKLGEILIEAGLIDEKQLETALAEQAKSREKLGIVLADLGLCSEEQIGRALASQSGVEYVDLDSFEIEAGAARLVPEALARRLGLVPIRIKDDTLVVAMSVPSDIVAIDEVQRCTDLFVQVVSAGHRQALRALDRAYGGDDARRRATDDLVTRALVEVESADGAMRESAGAARGALIELVNEIFSSGIRRDATDVHLQPDKKSVRVRYRVNGDLQRGPVLDRRLLAPVVTRIKVMAALDISETRIPQDGKILFSYEKGSVDLRVSTFPSVLGESVVVRILDKKRTFKLDTLGLEPREREVLERVTQRPNGLVLAVGPTGSGKSTTLYALLQCVDASLRNVITLEDPVEYELPMVTQCQVSERAGFTFSTGLRSILRHDPDVVLVGEMRDQETASLALRAALTGHLVFSTLHTNDAVRTLSRLFDMGIAGYVVASCLSVVAAQRLVRLICAHCRESYEPAPHSLRAVGLSEGVQGTFARGRGCDRCSHSGTGSRQALFEVLEITPPIAQMISRNAAIDEVEEEARRGGLIGFRERAQQLALAGRISVEEVARVSTEY